MCRMFLFLPFSLFDLFVIESIKLRVKSRPEYNARGLVFVHCPLIFFIRFTMQYLCLKLVEFCCLLFFRHSS